MSSQPPSFLSIIAIILVVILLFAVLTLYLIYFLNADAERDYGEAWTWVSISNENTLIKPLGKRVYDADAGSLDSSTITLGKPSGVPYVGRLFVVYNSSSSTNLEIKLDADVKTVAGVTIPIVVNPTSGVLFSWASEGLIVPLLQSASFS